MIMSLALIGPGVGPPEREGDGTPIEVLRKAIKWDRTIILRELCVTLLIVGLGQIGDRLAQLAKAFDMRVIGIRRDPRAGAGHADVVHTMSDLDALLPQADFVALTCPLTAETERLIDADALGRMKPSAYVLNAARGRVVDEPALIDALARRQIRGAALDVMVEEPLVRGLAAVVYGERAHHATHRGRDLPLRGRCARDHAGGPRAALARRC